MWFQQLINKLLKKWKWPGTLYTSGKYRYINDATVFPARNLHLLKVDSAINLQDAFFNVWDEIVLETDVVLGHQVMFLTGRHSVDEGGVNRQADSGGRIHIKQRAWLGSRAIILGGVVVGCGAVIGAGSVVTRSVPDHEFWAGNPAHFIRRLDQKEPLHD